MAIDKFNVCPICGAALSHNIHCGNSYEYYVNCPACGRFAIDEDYYDDFIDNIRAPLDKSEIASFLFYHKGTPPFPFLSGEDPVVPANHYRVSLAEMQNWYPKSFNKKVDTFLLKFGSCMTYMSEIISFTNDELASACFVKRNIHAIGESVSDTLFGQIRFFVNYLKEQDYIRFASGQCTILPKGLERIDVLQRESVKNTKNVFVAMSFAPEMTSVRKSIKDAIIECGYNPRIMDEIEHNHQIVPEMLYEIREARFVIAELTGHNNGAYFEAGYALGFGKEVIQVCEKSKFGTDGHFDVKQVNTILWDTTEDLTKRLIARIKATIS